MSSDPPIVPQRNPLYTLKTASQAYGIPLGDLRAAVDRGELKFARVPVMDWRLTGTAIETWLAQKDGAL